ncbi:thiamine phosphate synthase [Chelatococcus sp. SYSU_G07232]|uniref:Thiamine-phosphate synthase n=1 Tax=Chelatococcus albus TaxID=3047466 RepID=A0ABT7AGJ7_9HYPH|nr:thiamine phosphate synthase [Chelatococcus sp. SYSU_G07232]MDJ1158508.1 thiamine phosphate synthase [Chelatococcus sp. SYSU_G07232]
MTPVDLRLYAILDPTRTCGRDLPALAAAAVAGGTTLLQYRDKEADTRTLVARARAIRAATAGSGVPLLVNDRVDVALAAGADGVHIGQEDMAAEDARRLLGPAAIVGLTLKTEAHARALAGAPVDYACIGGVFATVSKHNPEPPVGLAGLAHIAEVARATAPGLPVGAIAGIDATNAAGVIGAGADGIAVISAVFMAEDVAAASRRLRAVVDEALAARGSTGSPA